MVTAGGLAQPERRVAYKVVDGEQLGKGSGRGVDGLGSEYGIPQTLVVSVKELLQQSSMKALRRLVEAQPAR